MTTNRNALLVVCLRLMYTKKKYINKSLLLTEGNQLEFLQQKRENLISYLIILNILSCINRVWFDINLILQLLMKRQKDIFSDCVRWNITRPSRSR